MKDAIPTRKLKGQKRVDEGAATVLSHDVRDSFPHVPSNSADPAAAKINPSFDPQCVALLCHIYSFFNRVKLRQLRTLATKNKEMSPGII